MRFARRWRLRIWCFKCRRLAEGLLGRIPPALAPHLRVVAAGAQVHLGERVPSAGWHVELLVGDCSAAYVERVIERASQFGMVADRDIVHLRGCPVCEDQVLEALERLEQTVAVHHA